MSITPRGLEAAIERVEALPDEAARATARDAVVAVLDLHREGLARLADRIRAASAEGDRTLEVAAEDEVVASLLSLHGLHPRPLALRVREAAARACSAEGGRVAALFVEGATARLRVEGSERVRRAVARALEEAAPELDAVEVLGSDPTLVPVGRLTAERAPAHERCHLCAEALAAAHEHVFDVAQRRLDCACAACAVLLDRPGASLRRVRTQARRLEDVRIEDAQWQALGVPVGLAFFTRSSVLDEVIASYPGPLGNVEALVPGAAWRELAGLPELEADTLAFVADRLRDGARYYLLSIDECYRLTAMVRRRWEGLTGGDGPLRAVEEFFGALDEVRS